MEVTQSGHKYKHEDKRERRERLLLLLLLYLSYIQQVGISLGKPFKAIYVWLAGWLTRSTILRALFLSFPFSPELLEPFFSFWCYNLMASFSPPNLFRHERRRRQKECNIIVVFRRRRREDLATSQLAGTYVRTYVRGLTFLFLPSFLFVASQPLIRSFISSFSVYR